MLTEMEAAAQAFEGVENVGHGPTLEGQYDVWICSFPDGHVDIGTNCDPSCGPCFIARHAEAHRQPDTTMDVMDSSGKFVKEWTLRQYVNFCIESYGYNLPLIPPPSPVVPTS